jgi:formate dehydrogenase maturation protein FdhE
MTQESSRPKLSGEQIVYLYERQLNFAVLWVILSGLAGVVLAMLFWFLLETLWVRMVLVVLSILGSGMVQRVVVLRVKCPACGSRPLGRIHSIIQSRGVRACPGCKAKLRS